MTTLVTVFQGQPQYDKTVAFATATTSATVDLENETLLGVVTPAGLTASTINIQVSTTLAGTYTNMGDETGTAITFPVTTSAEAISLGKFLPQLRAWRFVRFVSSNAQTATFTLATAVI